MNFFDPRMMDPSRLKPETLMKLSQLVQELPPALLNRMQSLMHNAMAGFDVKKDMEAFERDLPPGFREKLARLMYEANGVAVEPAPESPAAAPAPAPAPALTSATDARLTVLRAVASGNLSPEQALSVLFPESSN